MSQPPPGRDSRRKRCTIAFARPERQYLFRVELPSEASIADALAAARAGADPGADIPWDSAEVGIFGEPRARTELCAEGDRIELYRPLRADPRERRRRRVQRERRVRRS